MFYEKYQDQDTSPGRFKKKKRETAYKFNFSDCIGIISLRDVHCGFKILKRWHLASRYSWFAKHPYHCVNYFFSSSSNTEERGIHRIFISTGGSLLAGFAACGTRVPCKISSTGMSPCGCGVHSPGSPCWWDWNNLNFSWALAAVPVRLCCRETEIC